MWIGKEQAIMGPCHRATRPQGKRERSLLRQLSRGLGVLALVALAGCGSAPVKEELEQPDDNSIRLVENRSVDQAVRQDFAAAILLLKEEQYQPAVELLNKVVANTRDNSAPHINLGIAYSHLGKKDLAEASFLKALEINPDHPAALNELALFYRAGGRFEEARNLYERLIDKYPNYMPARKNYGILCDLYLNDARCAKKHYKIYSEAYPEDENVSLWIKTLGQKR